MTVGRFVEEAGRGVNFKNVRTLMKFGFFSYEENVQIDGRINRIRSIATDEYNPRKIKILFLLPSYDEQKPPRNARAKVEGDALNCYLVAGICRNTASITTRL
jgi:hypothetical protein